MGRLIAFPSPPGVGSGPWSFWPRLLTRAQAATYCGLTDAAFIAICPVLPITLERATQRERFDRYELDVWIGRDCDTSDQNGWLNWLALMEGRAS